MIKAAAVGERLIDLPIDFSEATRFSEYRYELATQLARRGDDERARALLEADARTLDDARWDNFVPEILIRRALAHDYLCRSSANEPSEGRAGAGASEKNPYLKLISPEGERLGAAAWAEEFARLLNSTPPHEKSQRASKLGHFMAERLGRRRGTAIRRPTGGGSPDR